MISGIQRSPRVSFPPKTTEESEKKQVFGGGTNAQVHDRYIRWVKEALHWHVITSLFPDCVSHPGQSPCPVCWPEG